MTEETLYPKVWFRAVARNLDPGWVRVWVGIDDIELPEALTWHVGETKLGDEAVRPVRELAYMPPGPDVTRTATGLYDVHLFDWENRRATADQPAPLRARRKLRVRASWAGSPEGYDYEILVQPLPSEVPHDDAGLQVLLTSCFYWDSDKSGRAGKVALMPPEGLKPDLVLAVGDQIYSDNPPRESIHFSSKPLTRLVEAKYRQAWRRPRGVGDYADVVGGYADVLGAGALAGIPDDHEYWNNYPLRGLAWPGTWVGPARKNWSRASRAGYDAFQCTAAPKAGEAWLPNRQPACCTSEGQIGCMRSEAFTHRIEVSPLSFFMMDNRTFRVADPGPGHPNGQPRMRSLRPCDLSAYQAWVEEVVADPTRIPILVTGPSLLQPHQERGWRSDMNFANLEEYGDIMRGVLRMTTNGCTPLLLTGDVHYPRVTRVTHANHFFYEIISSPASLVAAPWNPIKPPKARPAEDIGRGVGSFPGSLDGEMLWPQGDVGFLGNNLCFLRFVRRGVGVELHVEFRSVPDGRHRRRFDPPTIVPIQLRSLVATATARTGSDTRS